jgi:hypothetical protein
MPNYLYELRRGDKVIATGHLSSGQPVEVGDRITIGARSGIVRSADPLLGARERRLVVQIWRAREEARGLAPTMTNPVGCAKSVHAA